MEKAEVERLPPNLPKNRRLQKMVNITHEERKRELLEIKR